MQTNGPQKQDSHQQFQQTHKFQRINNFKIVRQIQTKGMRVTFVTPSRTI